MGETVGALYDSGNFWIALVGVVIVIGGVVVNSTASIVGARFLSRRASENALALALEIKALKTELVDAIHGVSDSLKEHERSNVRDFERVHDRVTDANDRISATREDLAKHPFTCLAATRLKQ